MQKQNASIGDGASPRLGPADCPPVRQAEQGTAGLPSTPVTVFLADDHPLFLNGVRQLLSPHDELDVVGEALSGGRALASILDLQPDVAVLDVAMPEMNGIEVVRRLGELSCPAAAIVLSTYEDGIYVKQALAAGARGYVLKRSAADSLLHAIRAVSQGGVYLDPAIAGQHIAGTHAAARTGADGSGLKIDLTDREQDVVRLIAFGFTSKEIGAKLSITAASVDTYKARACEKLGVQSRAKLVEYAILRGWFHGALT
jgi:DNA-binding NarL/FixJ family response regulator